MTTALVRPVSSIIWELRAAWGTGRRVALSLERADLARMEGHVSRVAATGVYVVVAGRSVPTDRVLAVHLPSRLGDSKVRGGVFHGAARVPAVAAGQLAFGVER